jgi:hypothetical protein
MNIKSIRPSLIEPMTKYMIQEKLKDCHNVRANIYSMILNAVIILLFVGTIGFTLYNIYINKPTDDEQREINLIRQHQIMNKISEFRTVPTRITNMTESFLYE